MVYFDHINEKYKIWRAIPHCNSWDSMYHIITCKVLQSTTKDCSLQSFRKHMRIKVHKILRLTNEFAHWLAGSRKQNTSEITQQYQYQYNCWPEGISNMYLQHLFSSLSLNTQESYTWSAHLWHNSKYKMGKIPFEILKTLNINCLDIYQE